MVGPVLQVENLFKRYGEVEAVRGVSFSVEEGEVFGLLGPNGAGKTSTIEILEGLRNADSGKASVCGFDPQRKPTNSSTKSAPLYKPLPCPTSSAPWTLFASLPASTSGAAIPKSSSSVSASRRSATLSS